jgi:hypothetical protein
MSPSPSPCQTKERLAEEMQRANSLLIELDNLDLEAVMKGEWDKSMELERKMLEMRLLREECVRAYRSHVQEHNC